MIARMIPALTALAWSLPAVAGAQIRASEAAVVSQTIDGTVITVSYSRPQLRGRPTSTDGVIHMEHMWTPGANWATTLETTKPIKLNGHPVAAGKYSVWMEPSDSSWSVHLHPNPRLFHTAAPKPGEMTLTFQVTPERAEETVEVLTFDFPAVRHTGADLRFRWAHVVLAFTIDVESSRNRVAMTEAQAAPYVGKWSVQFLNEVGEESPKMPMEILLSESGALRGVADGPAPYGMEFIPRDEEPHTFLIGFLMNGELFDVEAATPVVFEVKDGRADRWYARPVEGIGDKPWVWGTRRP